MNPFGSDEDEGSKNTSTNPFGSSDDEDEVTVISSQRTKDVSSTPDPVPRKSLAIPGINGIHEEAATRRGSAGSPSRLKPPVPAPRRISMVDPSGTLTPRPSSGLSVQEPTGTPRSVSSLSLESQTSASSFNTAVTPKKRQAPPVPKKAVDLPSASSVGSENPMGDAKSVSGGMRKTKKPAPPPPPAGVKRDVTPNVSNSELERSSETTNDAKVVSARFHPKSADSSASSSPAPVVRRSLFKNQDDREMDHSDIGENDSAEERKALELLDELNAEHRLIQAELRQLIDMPPERRTAAHQEREEQLLKDLMDNVKRREELEYEGSEEEPGQTLTNKPPKKMKKKRKFKIKKLLGVKT